MMHHSSLRTTHDYSILLFSFLLLLLLSSSCQAAWISATPPSLSARCTSTTKSALNYERYAEELPLTTQDLQMLRDMRSRHLTLPLLVLDTAILPGQRVEYASADPKYITMIRHVIELDGGGEIGVVGLDDTGHPLNIGVTFRLDMDRVQDTSNNELMITIIGERRFEISGDIWEEGEFPVCYVDLLDDPSKEQLNEEEWNKTVYLANEMPDLVDAWIAFVLSRDHATSGQIKAALRDVGPMPDTFAERAMWVATILNPTNIPKLNVCSDIRSSMLECRNDYDRLALAFAAMNSSIESMKDQKNTKK